ncbi:IclR family transcriptional regulator [Amycolatopsis lurida]
MPRDPQRGAGLRRDFALLEALASPEAAAADGLGVIRLAELTGREKSQVSRAMRALAEEGVVERHPGTLRYHLGWRLFALVARAAETRLERQAEPVMHRLAAEVEETTHLCVLREGGVVTVFSVSPGHSFRLAGSEGHSTHSACTSVGRVLLTDLTPDELHIRFGTTEPLCAEHPIRPRGIAELWVELNRVREQGYAVVDEEYEPGLVGVSAPIRDFRGRAVAALNLAAPKSRLGGRLHDAGRRTRQAAREISALLGHRPQR